MTAETLLSALNDIDDELLTEPLTEVPHLHRSRRLIVLIAAVIALLVVTACAAGEISGWLESFFVDRADSGLSPDQIGYITENEQLISESQTFNGYTVELDSYIATTNTVYVVFSVTAPRDVILYEGVHMEADFRGEYGRTPAACIIYKEDDHDGLDNTLNYVYIIQHKDTYSVPAWNVSITSLYMMQYNETTQQHDNIILSEGPWNFTIDLTNSDTQAVELLTEPIQTLGIVPWTDDDTFSETVEELTVTSFVLSPLDAVITYEPINECFARFTGFVTYTNIEFHAYVILKDGHSIEFQNGHPNKDGECKLLADSPIVLEEVDYIRLADGTKLTVP